jgi:hypothetical protein
MAPRQVQPCVVKAGKEARVDFGAPEGGAAIEGRVKTAKPLSPRYTMSICRVEDMTPTGGWKATVIAPEGTFRFDALEGGPHELYLATPGGEEIVKLAAVEVPLAGVVKVDVELPAGTIEGAVAAASNGSPIDGAILIVERGDAPVGTGAFLAKILTNAEGAFAVPFLPPGSYRLTAYDPTGARAAQRVEPLTVAAGHETPKVRLYLGLAGSIQVTVRDAKGAPVCDIEIQLSDAAGRLFEFHGDRVVTDEQGRWTASGVPPGRWSVRALDGSRKIAEGTADVREQGTATVEFTFVR